MFVHLGHLGHLTPKPQQNRPFFNLSNMANNKYLGLLARPRTPALRTSASEVYPDVCRDGKKSSSPLRHGCRNPRCWRTSASGRHGCRNPDVTGVANRDLLTPNSQLLVKKYLLILPILIILPQNPTQRPVSLPVRSFSRSPSGW